LLAATALLVALLLLERRDELMRALGLRAPPSPPSAEELARRDAFCAILEETSAAYVTARADADGARRVRGMEQARADHRERIARLLPDRGFERWPAEVEHVLLGGYVELRLGGACPAKLVATAGGDDPFVPTVRRLGRGDTVWISGFFQRAPAGADPFYVSGIAEAERMTEARLEIQLTALERAP
jgi:hypothetical protein